MSDLHELLHDLDDRLVGADARLGRLYPGERGVRQPVHTVYVPADTFGPELATAWAGRRERHSPSTRTPSTGSPPRSTCRTPWRRRSATACWTSY